MKIKTSVTIDTDLYLESKRLGLSFSEILNTGLKTRLQLENTEPYKEIRDIELEINDLNNNIKNFQDQKLKLSIEKDKLTKELEIHEKDKLKESVIISRSLKAGGVFDDV